MTQTICPTRYTLYSETSAIRFSAKMSIKWAVMVVAQLVERLIPTPEIRSSNAVWANFIHYQLYNNG